MSTNASAGTMITDLGTLGTLGYGTNEAVAVNDNGQVVGTSFTASEKSHAFSWTAAGGMVDLTLGGTSSRPVAVANSGQVIGYDHYTANSLVRTFSWTAAGGIVDIGTIYGTQSYVAAMNESGQVAGYSCADANQQDCRAFSWTAAGGMVNLGALLGDAPSFPKDVNYSGQVVGYWKPPLGDYRAFSWTAGGGMVDLGTLAGRTGSFAEAVSDSGHVVGQSSNPNPGPASARVDRRAFSWTEAGGMVDLGTLGGDDSWARYVNSNGQVVGVSRTAGFAGESHAFSWTVAGGMVDLGALGGYDSAPLGLSDSGVVMGYATGDTFQYAFAWTATEGTTALTLGGKPPFCNGCSYPRGISQNGRVVGFSYTSDEKYHAFSWTAAGGITDLGTLGGGNGNATYSDALAANNRGQLAGWAYTPGGTGYPQQHPVLWQTAFSLGLPDINSNGAADLAVVRAGPIRAEIRDGQAGALLKTLKFLDDGFTPHAVAAMPDSDGNGVAELAVLATRNSDGRMLVEIRNVSGAQAGRQIWFAANHTPVAMAVIASDADNNGIAELAVLSKRRSDGRGLVEVKNAFGATNPRSLWVGAGLTPTHAQVIDDADKNGAPEVAVLSTRDSDGRIVVETRNASGPSNPKTVWFMAGNKAVDLAVVDDADQNTIPEIAVLSKRNSDGRVVIEVKNAAGPTNPNSVWLPAGHTALALQVVADADGNAIPELAVLLTRDSDGRALVDVRNAAGAANPNAVWFSPGFSVSVLTVNDGGVGGTPEVAVLLNRNGDGRVMVQSQKGAGSPEPKNYWFSP